MSLNIPKQVRDYFRASIYRASKEVNFQPTEHPLAVFEENISDNAMDDTYFIGMRSINTGLEDSSVNDLYEVTVSIYRRLFNENSIEYYDNALMLAHCVRVEAMKPKYSRTGQYIKDVVCTNIESDNLDTDENAVKITLSFNVRVFFCIGE